MSPLCPSRHERVNIEKTIYVHTHTCETVMLIHVSHMFMKKYESCCLSAADFTQIKIVTFSRKTYSAIGNNILFECLKLGIKLFDNFLNN